MSQPSLARRLGTGDAVVIGLGPCSAPGSSPRWPPPRPPPAPCSWPGLGIAAVVTACNALSSAQLAAPSSGGTYVYGRRQLGPFWGHLAGFGVVVGKTASCAALALTVGAYAAPALARPLAVASVALTGGVLRGVAKTARRTRVLVIVVLLVLALVVLAGLLGGTASAAGLRATGGVGAYAVLQSAVLLFFAFAGYARIATLGEEVRDPERTIPRAIPLALGAPLALYAAAARRSRWPARASCRTGSPPSTRCAGCRTTPRSPSPSRSSCWSWWSTCAGRSVSQASQCSSTTP